MKTDLSNFEDIRRDLDSCVDRIENDSIRKLVEDVFEKIKDSPFWTHPGSPSGRYHPPENQLKHGLVIHTVKTVHAAETLFKFWGIESPLEQDIVRAACLLHDTMKGHPFWKTTQPNHGEIAAGLVELTEFDGPGTFKDLVVYNLKECISLHNSRWTYPARELAKATTPTNMVRCVQLADMIASRKGISYYPTLDITGVESRV